jgi:hypothetical protein
MVLLMAGSALWAADEMTVYDLQSPGSHAFDIIYDVSATREGAEYFMNPIRKGSTASKERVIDRATGKPLEFEIVQDGAYLRVKLARPVAKGSEARIRIYKTYTDAPSYYEKDGGFVFDRPLGIKRNVVILPKGYELTGSASPAIVSLEADGRVHVSFLNDRDDQLPVRITGRKLP